MLLNRRDSIRTALLAATLLLIGLGSGRAAAQVECLVLTDASAPYTAAEFAVNTSGIQYTSWDWQTQGDPTAGDIAPFDVVLVYLNASCPADSVGLGDELYDWYDDGGVGIVLGTAYWRLISVCGGMGMLETIDPMDPATEGGVTDAVDSASVWLHPVTEDLFTLESFVGFHGGAQLAAGAVNLASWSQPNLEGTTAPAAGIRSDFVSRMVGVSMSPTYSQGVQGVHYDGDFYPLYENAILWSAGQSCPPWEIPMGAADSSSDSSDEVKLDILEVTEDVILEDFEFYADVAGMESATFVVYEGIAAAWNYDRIWSEDLTISGSGWHSSGEINIPLTAGRFYAIGIEVSQDITYYWTNAQPTVDEWWGVHESAESVDDPDSVISVTPSTGVAYVMQANLAAICDVDGDGHDRPYDCDDADAAVDDAGLDLWYADTDGDGFGDPAVSIYSCSQPAGFVADDTDSDDANPLVHPAALEMCDGFDNDCDGDVDEDDAVDAGTWYADSDGDTYGDPAASTLACAHPQDHVADDTDCDDTDASVNPSAVEICDDGIDNDCDGLVDLDDEDDCEDVADDDDDDSAGDDDDDSAGDDDDSAGDDDDTAGDDDDAVGDDDDAVGDDDDTAGDDDDTTAGDDDDTTAGDDDDNTAGDDDTVADDDDDTAGGCDCESNLATTRPALPASLIGFLGLLALRRRR